jgi:hypothetical protein
VVRRGVLVALVWFAVAAAGCSESRETTRAPVASQSETIRAFGLRGVDLEPVECEPLDPSVPDVTSCWHVYEREGRTLRAVADLQQRGHGSVRVVVLDGPFDVEPAAGPTVIGTSGEGIVMFFGNVVAECADRDCGGQLDEVKAALDDLGERAT